jgi:hypothetical protein
LIAPTQNGNNNTPIIALIHLCTSRFLANQHVNRSKK